MPATGKKVLAATVSESAAMLASSDENRVMQIASVTTMMAYARNIHVNGDSQERPLPQGKLPPDLLTEFLLRLPSADPAVVVGARYGEDAAVLDLGDRYLVLAMDPVTLSLEPGRVAVQINANDVAVMGATPRWMLATVLLPPTATAGDASRIVEQLAEGCQTLEVSLIGGHTEITAGVTQPVVAACMVGDVTPDRLVTSSGAREEDAVVLAGPLAVEGTGILSREFADDLTAAGVPAGVIAQGARLLDVPGISVLAAVRVLLAAVHPHALHDPTEGGLIGALCEMAAASELGVRLDADAVPILPACTAICEALTIDPLRLLASGAVLAAMSPEDARHAVDALHAVGIEGARIGSFVSQQAGMTMVRHGVVEPLPKVTRDELSRWIESRGR